MQKTYEMSVLFSVWESNPVFLHATRILSFDIVGTRTAGIRIEGWMWGLNMGLNTYVADKLWWDVRIFTGHIHPFHKPQNIL